MAALPDTAPAKPKQPRRRVGAGQGRGLRARSIPLAARTIEAIGQKTGAWTTVITYNAADINAENLQQLRRDLPRQHDRALPRRSGESVRNRAPGVRRCWSSSAAARGWPGFTRRPTRITAAAGRRPAPAAGAPRRRRQPAVARVQQADRRLLQVPLALPDADRRQDRRSGEPDQRAFASVNQQSGARLPPRRSRSSTRSTPSTRTPGRGRTRTS